MIIKTLLQIFLLIVLSFSVCLSNDSFIISSLAEAEKLSQSTGQPLLLIFGADYCVYCNKLKTDILKKEVGPSIDSFIVCYIDLENNPAYRKKYNLSTIPDSRIIVNGKQVSRMQGYSRSDFSKWIENVKW